MMAGCCSQGFAQFLCVLLAQLGLLLSLYSFYVEKMNTTDPKYKALCDINAQMSCTRVFSSKYGTGFGVIGPLLGLKHPLNVANSVYGAVLFFLLTLLSVSNARSVWLKLHLLLSVVATGGSCYLAYILVYVLKDMCVVCVASYIVSALLLILSLCRLACAPSVKIQPNYSSNKKRAKRD